MIEEKKSAKTECKPLQKRQMYINQIFIIIINQKRSFIGSSKESSKVLYRDQSIIEGATIQYIINAEAFFSI